MFCQIEFTLQAKICRHTSLIQTDISNKYRRIKTKMSLIPDEQVTESHSGVLASYSEEDKQRPQGTGPLIVRELTHNQGNMGVPLPSGLRCQGSAWYDVVGLCPESQGGRNHDRGGGEGSGRGCLTTGVGLSRGRRRRGSRGGESALSPPRKTQSPPGHGEICGEYKSLLLYSVLFTCLCYGSFFSDFKT